MHIQRVETRQVVAMGSDGNLYDLYRIVPQTVANADGIEADFERAEWLTSTGVVVETEDEWLFRLGNITIVETADRRR